MIETSIHGNYKIHNQLSRLMPMPRIVLLPTGCAGHLMSMVEMARRFLCHHPTEPESHFSITILVPCMTINPVINSYIDDVAATGLNIAFEDLPEIEEPTRFDGHADFTSQAMAGYKPSIHSFLSRLLSSSVQVAALVIDLFATTAIDAASELDIPTYVYFTSGATFLALMLHLPTLHEKFPSEFEDMEKELEVPGMSPVPSLSIPVFLKKKNGGYTWFVYHARRFCETKGLIVNTFAEFEPAALEALKDGKSVTHRPTPPVYPVGPIVALKGAASGERRHECLNWLDSQPGESVVFLCFGSRGSFKVSQAREVAAGLERSGQRFLWVLRLESSETLQLPEDADEVLPEGFTERTKERGLVWTSWVPQTEILGHPAIEGFVTHCGWNSTLESLWFGVPMLGWPLYAEQHHNSFVMAKDLGVSLQLKIDRKNSNFVGAAELERGVRSLMEECEEGSRVRAKVKEMKLISRTTMQEGGSSFAFMEELVKVLKT